MISTDDQPQAVRMQSESEKLIELESVPTPVSEEIPDALPVVEPPPAQSMPRRAIDKASEIRHKMPKSLKLKIKIVLSLVMFGSLPLFLKIDPAKTWEALIRTNPWLIGFTAVVFISTILLAARRWQILTRAVGFKRPFWELCEYCYVGLFFNLFLPSTVGGDFSRCYYVSKGTGKYAEAVYSVLADRASGLAVLFITAAFGIALGPGARDLPWQLKWPIFVGTAGLFFVLPFMPALTMKILGPEHWIAKRFNDPRLLVFWNDKKLIFGVLGWSCITQFLMVACHFGVACALGIADKIPIWYYFVFYPCVAVLGFVTPSFNGIGIREWAYTYFLMHCGVQRTEALTYALLWLALTTLLSLVGGVVYVGAKLTPPPPQDEED
jgi:glycosyltransferase 2 family protein